MLHEVSVAGLTLDQTSNTPILLLKTIDGDESIPIWIGLLEATSIASALQGIGFERPMTHDLFRNFLEKVNCRVAKVDICDLKDNTFYSEIHFITEGRKISMDARPSDAIAIALRFKAPIFVDDMVISKLNQGGGEAEVVDNSDEGKKWAEYLKKLSPEDFGKYKI